MKHWSILAVAALAWLTAGAARAQGDVTLYGVLETAVAEADGDAGAKLPSLAGAPPARGREDLGNGLAAVFRLERGVAPDRGTLGRRLTGRVAASPKARWGTVTIGRQAAQAGVMNGLRNYF